MASFEVRLSRMVPDESQRGYHWDLVETFTIEALDEPDAVEHASQLAEQSNLFYQVRETEREQTSS